MKATQFAKTVPPDHAGAAVIHVHIRDGDARPTLDVGRLTDTVHALRESTDLIVQLSTGGAVTDSFERRLAVLDAGEHVEISTADVNQVLQRLMQQQVSLARLQIRERTLEDLFLELTGKELRP